MILCFLNQKGGVGKSTLATNAADYLQRLGRSVLLVDADPQATTTRWAELREEMNFPVIHLARPNMTKEILDLGNNYDDVVIDGPPRAEALSRAAIIAADLVVIPIEPSGASDWACKVTVEQVQEAAVLKEIHMVFVISRAIARTIISRSIRDYVAETGVPLLRAVITNRVVFAEALTMGKTVYEWDPSSAGAREMSNVMEEIGDWYEKGLDKTKI